MRISWKKSTIFPIPIIKYALNCKTLSYNVYMIGSPLHNWRGQDLGTKCSKEKKDIAPLGQERSPSPLHFYCVLRRLEAMRKLAGRQTEHTAIDDVVSAIYRAGMWVSRRLFPSNASHQQGGVPSPISRNFRNQLQLSSANFLRSVFRLCRTRVAVSSALIYGRYGNGNLKMCLSPVISARAREKSTRQLCKRRFNECDRGSFFILSLPCAHESIVQWWCKEDEKWIRPAIEFCKSLVENLHVSSERGRIIRFL